MKNKSKGFTLLEMLVVIITLSILSLISISTYDKMRADASFAKAMSFEKQLQTDMMSSFESYVSFWTFQFLESNGAISDISGQKNHIPLPPDVLRINEGAHHKMEEQYNLSFDGTGSGLDIPGNTTIPKNKITISLWFKLNRHKNYNQLFRYIDSRILIRVANNKKLCFNIGHPPNRTDTCYEEDIELDKWYHVAGVYDGQKMQLYVDGIVVDEEPKVGYDLNPTDGTQMWLGRGNSIPGSVLDGYIDNVYVWGNNFTWD